MAHNGHGQTPRGERIMRKRVCIYFLGSGAYVGAGGFPPPPTAGGPAKIRQGARAVTV